MRIHLFNITGNILLFFLLLCENSNAQVTDTVETDHKTSQAVIQLPKQEQHHPGKFRLCSYALPTLMFTYGVVSLKNHELGKINRNVKEELWDEGAKRNAHIDNFLQYAPAVAVYALNIAGIKGKNNFRDRTMIYMMSNFFTYSIVSPLKKITHELRPDGSSYESFPSGHTAEAFLSAEFLRQEYKDISPWYGIAGYAVAATTGFLRMYNNKHWLSDVIAGAGVGIVSTKLAYYVYPFIKQQLFHKKEMHSFIMPYYQGKQAGFSMVYNFH